MFRTFVGCTIIISKYVMLPTDNKESLQMVVCQALVFCCRSCFAMEVGWRMSLPLYFIKRVTFFFMLPHPNLLSVHLMNTQWTHCLFIFNLLCKTEKLYFQYSVKIWGRYSPTRHPEFKFDLYRYTFYLLFNYFY